MSDTHCFKLNYIVLCLLTLSSIIARSYKNKRSVTYEFKYHSNEQIESYLKRLNEEYPSITRVYSIGKSLLQKELFVIEITTNPGIHTPLKPEFKYIANMHGNEAVGREMMLLLATHLCKSYNRDDRLTWLIQNTRIHLMPSMNPDGYDLSVQGGKTDWLLGRTNAASQDLNRNFPNTTLFEPSNIQPETLSVMNWIQTNSFTLSGNIHGGSLVANYPYDSNPENENRYTPTDDNDIFVHLARIYSISHPTMHLPKPTWDCPSADQDNFPDGITNGAAWYPVNNGMQDYNYEFSNCFELTLEIGCVKFPKESTIAHYWEENREPLIRLMEQIHMGVKGMVTDMSGRPLKDVMVTVSNRKHPVYTSQYGDYFRLLTPGNYDVLFQKPGYEAKVVAVTVPEKSAAIISLELQPSKVQRQRIYDSKKRSHSFLRDTELRYKHKKYVIKLYNRRIHGA